MRGSSRSRALDRVPRVAWLWRAWDARAAELLWEAEGLPAFDLPEELESLYGGPFGIESPLLYANFVETLDGVVAIRSEPRSNRLVSGGSESDRFVMGLLRACADCVLVGSGTLHGSPKALWTPERAHPDESESFAELRRGSGSRQTRCSRS